MNIDAIQALGGQDEVPGSIAAAASPSRGADFGAQVAQGLQDLNAQLLASQVDLQHLAAGETANLHEVMVRLEESRIALQLALQVRSRALEAYQDLMRMQV